MVLVRRVQVLRPPHAWIGSDQLCAPLFYLRAMLFVLVLRAVSSRRCRLRFIYLFYFICCARLATDSSAGLFASFP